MFTTMNAQEVNVRLGNIIFHIDVNSAYLSWEAVYRLAHKGERQDLREIASAVGGRYYPAAWDHTGKIHPG